MSEDRTILLIGSGPIQIGQAAEFDYSGAQACRALQEEGARVVLVNSNPATIMTDPETADRVYIEPITPEAISEVIRIEEPDGVIAGLGGQTGLNVTAELAEEGILEEYDVEVMGTPLDTIYATEDRDLFRQRMEGLGQPVPASTTISLDEGESVTDFDEGGLPRARAGRRRRGRRAPRYRPDDVHPRRLRLRRRRRLRGTGRTRPQGSASRGTARCSSPSPSLAGSNWSTK